jgi:hypothetical protein
MFFTGGVDSFYTLLRRGQTLERLVFVDGFDLGLEQRARFAPVRATLETVARETGLRVEFPRTNIRRDPTFATLPWGTTFGAALAAVGHMLATSTSRILMASSSVDANWGSTPELDPLWSSGAVAFVHDGTETDKYGKMRAIADWPLAMRFLRVCFAPRRAGLNCGICEKCVRTQAMFAAIGRHDRLRTFPPGSLQERIDAVPYVPAINRPGWRITSERLGDPRLAAAIDRMLARPPPAGARLKAAAWRWFDRLPGSRGLRRIVRQARRREAR